MTQEQEIRAWALLIAEVKNQGHFAKVLKGHQIIEFNDRHLNYLAAIEAYIATKNYRLVSDNGDRLSGEIG